MSEDDDGGMQWYAEVGEQEERAQREADALKAHAEWVKEFYKTAPSAMKRPAYVTEEKA